MTAGVGAVAVELLINVDVDDLEAAIRFYGEGIGLQLKRRLFDDTVAELRGAAAPVFLLRKAGGSLPSRNAAEVRSYRRHWTPVHLDIAVAEIEPAVERAIRAGGKAEGPVQSFAWGRQALMCDPFGNGFCFVQWLGGGYDAVAAPGQ